MPAGPRRPLRAAPVRRACGLYVVRVLGAGRLALMSALRGSTLPIVLGPRRLRTLTRSSEQNSAKPAYTKRKPWHCGVRHRKFVGLLCCSLLAELLAASSGVAGVAIVVANCHGKPLFCDGIFSLFFWTSGWPVMSHHKPDLKRGCKYA